MLIKNLKNKILYGRLCTAEKIFCISMQRTGTTSTGQFFKDHGFEVANWNVSRNNKWGYKCFIGDYEKIFSSKDFNKSQVFEDGPWWYGDFYRVLFFRFPSSRFVLFRRDENKWFDSMIMHSNGKVLGNTYRHMSLYNRLSDYYDIFDTIHPFGNEIDNKVELLEEHREHYISEYKNRNKSIVEFFNQFDKNRLFYGELEDVEIWTKLSKFINIKIDLGYNVHVNKSSTK